MKFLVLNGPGLDSLCERVPLDYPEQSLNEINHTVRTHAASLGAEVEFIQSNNESDLVAQVKKAQSKGYRGILYNPGNSVYTNPSLYKAISETSLMVIEIHMSPSVALKGHCQFNMYPLAVSGGVSGHGPDCYKIAITDLVESI